MTATEASRHRWFSSTETQITKQVDSNENQSKSKKAKDTTELIDLDVQTLPSYDLSEETPGSEVVAHHLSSSRSRNSFVSISLDSPQDSDNESSNASSSRATCPLLNNQKDDTVQREKHTIREPRERILCETKANEVNIRFCKKRRNCAREETHKAVPDAKKKRLVLTREGNVDTKSETTLKTKLPAAPKKRKLKKTQRINIRN